MRIIPVIDLLNGVAVRAVAGNRSEYQPVRSTIAASPDPSVVLKAFAELFPVTACYIADLDAIQGRSLNRCVMAELSRSNVKLIVDRGVRCPDDAQELLDLGVEFVVVALESVPHLQLAADLIARFGSRRLIFSIDLQHQKPLTANPDWDGCGPTEIAAMLTGVGYRNLIILDLAAVGTANGPVTTAVCRELRQAFPEVNLISGGGIRGISDLHHLQSSGCDAALVSSALHDGSIAMDDLRTLTGGI